MKAKITLKDAEPVILELASKKEELTKLAWQGILINHDIPSTNILNSNHLSGNTYEVEYERYLNY